MADTRSEGLADSEPTLLITNSVRSLVPQTSMAADAKPFIEAEIAAVKANLLYANRIDLNSYLIDIYHMNEALRIKAQMPLRAVIIILNWLKRASDETLSEYYITRTPEMRRLLNEYTEIVENPGRTADDVLAFHEEHTELFNAGLTLLVASRRFSAEVIRGFDVFKPLEQSGLLTVQGWSEEIPGLDESEQDYVDRAGKDLMDAIQADERLISLDTGASSGLIVRSESGRRAEIQVASQILNQLPGFSRASLDEIVDIREELKHPIRRFRSEIAETSADFTGELDQAELHRLWARKIQPALDEIDELSEENKYLKRLADSLFDPKTTLASGGLLTLGFAGLTGIAQIVSASAGLAALPLEALKSTRKGRKEITKKRFYFVWRMR